MTVASKEATVRIKIDMSSELRKAFDDFGEGMAKATAALAQIAPKDPAAAPKGSDLAAAKSTALYAFLVVLDDWIEGAHSNHEALDHRGEVRPCWITFAPADIRTMINDACREVGISEFPYPNVPKEDTL